MRDDERGTLFQHALYGLLYELFCFCVDGAGRFVQDKQRGVKGERACKRDELLLAYGQACAALFYFRSVAFGQSLYEAVCVNFARSPFDALIFDSLIAQTNIARHSPAKEKDILKNYGKVFSQR